MEKLEKAYVAFIDVLGFKNIVYNNNHEKLSKFFEITKTSFELFDQTKAKLKKFILSDSIIFAIEQGENNLKEILIAIRNLQAFLAAENIWVRGAISFGDVYMGDWGDGKIIYGDGYIKAYELEKKAVYPRVIIDPRFIPLVSTDRKSFMEKFSCFSSSTSGEFNHFPDINVIRLDDDLVASSIISTDATNDDDLFIAYGSRLLLADLQFSGDGKHIETIYEHLKVELYREYSHSPKYNWVKKYFVGLLSNAQLRLTVNPTIRNDIFLKAHKFSCL